MSFSYKLRLGKTKQKKNPFQFCLKTIHGTKIQDDVDDGFEHPGHFGFGGGRCFSGDWFGHLRFHCFCSLLRCFLVQRQGRILRSDMLGNKL